MSVTNTDDDVAGIQVTPVAGLTTTEAGGTATFTVVLQSQPTANVTIGLSSSDLTEGTVAPASLTFTAANWNVAQTVTATGVDDFVDDGDIVYSIVTAAAASSDANYNGLNASDVSVTNTDNDTAGFTVTRVSVGALGAEFRVNTTTADIQQINVNTRQAVGIDSVGNFVVVWESNLLDGSGYGVYA